MHLRVEARLAKEDRDSAQETMLAERRTARERTRAFVEGASHRDPSAHRWRHVFLRMLNLYEWFEMIVQKIAAALFQKWEKVRENGTFFHKHPVNTDSTAVPTDKAKTAKFPRKTRQTQKY
jgi:hypothetical protein